MLLSELLLFVESKQFTMKQIYGKSLLKTSWCFRGGVVCMINSPITMYST